MTSNRTITRYDALREAKRLVGAVRPLSGGWVFSFWDFRANAMRESAPCNIITARKLRSVTVAVTAHRILCGDDVDIVAAQEIAHVTGGEAEDRLSAILRALPVPARKMAEAQP